ncbi:MAG: hypothetical protein JXA20_07895 [Spirochaetes bacterium]|nr:hypothetical protein [Spirochaetota bacterium]
MKRTGLALILVLASVLLVSPLMARESDTPGASIGFTLQAGMNDVNQRHGSGAWEAKPFYGGGLIVEYMFTGLLGIHSGVNFTYRELSFRDLIATNPSYTRTYSTTLEIPLCLVAAVHTSFCSVQFLSGIIFAQTLTSRGHMKSTEWRYTANLLPYINGSNFGLTGGVMFRFPLTQYSDFVVGGTASYYLTDLFIKRRGTIANLYDYRGSVGFLFRTGLLTGR